jgi:hypothetical protein
MHATHARMHTRVCTVHAQRVRQRWRTHATICTLLTHACTHACACVHAQRVRQRCAQSPAVFVLPIDPRRARNPTLRSRQQLLQLAQCTSANVQRRDRDRGGCACTAATSPLRAASCRSPPATRPATGCKVRSGRFHAVADREPHDCDGTCGREQRDAQQPDSCAAP